MTVDRYEAKFTKLSRYAPKLIEDLVDRAKRFQDYLKLDIRSQLVPLNLKNYNNCTNEPSWYRKNHLDQATTATYQGGTYHLAPSLN